MSMNEKKAYIRVLSNDLQSKGSVMFGKDLAEDLNNNGFQTEYGTKYKGGRGTYRLIKLTWEWLHNDLQLLDEAKVVALAFVKKNGEYAYK